MYLAEGSELQFGSIGTKVSKTLLILVFNNSAARLRRLPTSIKSLSQ
jgi:hypothetical protein